MTKYKRKKDHGSAYMMVDNAAAWWTQSKPISTYIKQSLLAKNIDSKWVPFSFITLLKLPEQIIFDEYDAVFLVSRYAADACAKQGVFNTWKGLIICSGPKTAEHLKQKYSIDADVVFYNLSAKEIFESNHQVFQSIKYLMIPIGTQSKEKYKNLVGKAYSHITVKEWLVYESLFNETAEQNADLVIEKLKSRDYIIFASPSAWNNFYSYYSKNNYSKKKLAEVNIMAIGPVTAATIIKSGFNVQQPLEFSLESVGEMMLEQNEVLNLSFKRNRRLRQNSLIRDMLMENRLMPSDLILPIFVTEIGDQPIEITSMPGVYQYPLQSLKQRMLEIVDLGIKAIILFGIPKHKDEIGTQAYCSHGIVQKAIKQIKDLDIDLMVIADTCMCEYTSHGHCGVICDQELDNDQSLPIHVKVAVSQAEAGADIIAPSSCLDGVVNAIRHGLDQAGYSHVPIMSYAVKYASAYYGPFREAAESAPTFGDRESYQLPFSNQREAKRELIADVDEGADMVIVKPALSYLDIVNQTRNTVNLPVIAYNVSGEYAMVKAAALNGWVDEQKIVIENLVGMKRAGADMIITYHAEQVAKWMNKND